MRRLPLALLPLLVLLFCESRAVAIPITLTSGQITMIPNGNFSAAFGGSDFSYFSQDTSLGRGAICGPCLPGAGIPTTINVFLPAGGNFPLIYNGVTYGGGMGLGQAGGVITLLAPVAIPADLRPVTVPFTFFGTANADLFFDQDGPLFFELSGSGMATFNFAANPSGTNVTGVFNFQPAAVPEPATMLLLGMGLAGVMGAARRRRKRVSS